MGRGTPLGRVRGLGSAKSGTHEWLRHKITAGSNLFLLLWLAVSILHRPGFDYPSLHGWMQSAWVAVPMALLIVSVFTHFRLGLRTVIEDYQHDESRVVMLVLLNFFTVGLGATALFAIAKIAFGASR
jgi:succinate dehydrogenase / fumarate reductase membrane anchor subunit